MLPVCGKSEADRLLGEVAGNLLDRISRGEHPQVEEYVEQYPKIADLIRDTFPALQMMQDATDRKFDFQYRS